MGIEGIVLLGIFFLGGVIYFYVKHWDDKDVDKFGLIMGCLVTGIAVAVGVYIFAQIANEGCF